MKVTWSIKGIYLKIIQTEMELFMIVMCSSNMDNFTKKHIGIVNYQSVCMNV